MVMVDATDGVRSFAIDAFPIMEPSAIEAFWERAVEARRTSREDEFARLAAAGDT
jgi:hypothetical protein